MNKENDNSQVCGDAIATNPESTNQNHCGLDASCQVGSVSVQDPNESQPADVPVSINQLVGMQVIKVCGPKCKDCTLGDGPREYPSGGDMSSCVKVELVGGYYLCLAPIPIVTE